MFPSSLCGKQWGAFPGFFPPRAPLMRERAILPGEKVQTCEGRKERVGENGGEAPGGKKRTGPFDARAGGVARAFSGREKAERGRAPGAPFPPSLPGRRAYSILFPMYQNS